MRHTLLNERGFGLVELSVVMALIGVLSIFAVPSLLSYYQSSSLTAGTEELAAVMNRARQLAISRNTSVCVERNGTMVRFRTTTAVPPNCTGTIFTGGGTDSGGNIRIANSLQVSGAINVIFTNAGGATASSGSMPVTYTLTDPQTSRSRNVVVTSTGRVSIQ
jgi:prepilin-type N-terminal cleavage/methylation domain-containing protein